jgi:very-short-patch-repair endonuclease
MSDPKVETLKKEITDNIVNEFNLQIDEVLSMCESEIEKLMLLHLYRYFQTFYMQVGGMKLFNKYSPLIPFKEYEDIEDEIILGDPDVSTFENLKLEKRVRKYNYRDESYHFLKNIGFKVANSFFEGLSLDSKSNSPLIDELVSREFEVIPQYPVSVDGIEYRLDIAIILNRKTVDGKVIESKKVALECDGYDYHSSPMQKRNDDIRTRKLKKSGWKEVLRYSGKELHSLKSIKEVHSLFEEIIEILLI